MVCGILVPCPGTEPGSPHCTLKVLTTRPPGNSCKIKFFYEPYPVGKRPKADFHMSLEVGTGAGSPGARLGVQPLGSRGCACLGHVTRGWQAVCEIEGRGLKGTCVPTDDEHVWKDDGHPGRTAQEPQHQGLAGAHAGLGHHLQIR